MTLSSSGAARLIGPSRPNAATTAVNASTTGTSAATTAPNASRSTSSVTGSASSSARRRSLEPELLLALPGPSAPIVNRGWALAAAASAPSNAPPKSPFAGPVSSAECRSRVIRTVISAPSTRRILRRTSAIVDRNAGASTVRVALCTYP